MKLSYQKVSVYLILLFVITSNSVIDLSKLIEKAEGGSYTEDSQKIPEGFRPCNGRKYCGEVRNFRNENHASRFITQNRKPTLSFEQLLRSDDETRGQYFKTVSDTFSGTNNQVLNVDEADILKTEGNYIYTISNNKLSIIKPYPIDDLEVLSTVQFIQGTAKALLLEGNFLAVIIESGAYEEDCPQFSETCIQIWVQITSIRVYDISDRSNPILIEVVKIDGKYFNGRKTNNGWIYILSTQGFINRQNPLPWYQIGSVKTYIPSQKTFYYDHNYNDPVFLNVFTFNLANADMQRKELISIATQNPQNAKNLYMAEKNIYISFSEETGGKKYTTIHKVFVNQDELIPFADGKVRGEVRSQFWMDEFESFFRVCAFVNDSNIGQDDRNKYSNSVYTLNNDLEIYGEISGIGKGEEIFSARYAQRRLYMVTFNTSDPFFVIDFTNHRTPKVIGQVHLLGYSTYLHIYDNTTIIGFGRHQVRQDTPLGLKLVLFDVSDPNNPQVLEEQRLEEIYSNSIAELEHKAFLFSRQKHLLVIPLELYHDADPNVANDTNVRVNGAIIFRVDKDASDKIFEVKQLSNHFKGTHNDLGNFYQSGVERSLYIGDYLYTKSKCLLQVHSLQSNSLAQEMDIPC